MMFEHNKRIFWVNEIKPSANLGVKSAANIINSIFIVRIKFEAITDIKIPHNQVI